MSGISQLRILLQKRERVLTGGHQPIPIANQVREAERKRTGLSRAEELSRPADLEVGLGDFEAVLGPFENVEAGIADAVRIGSRGVGREEITVRGVLASPHASP